MWNLLACIIKHKRKKVEKPILKTSFSIKNICNAGTTRAEGKQQVANVSVPYWIQK